VNFVESVTDRGAQYSEFGWQFQIVCGIILALNNARNFTGVNIEGPRQDVEIDFENKKKILGQAKAYAKTDIEETGATGWSKKLESGIVGLFENFLTTNNVEEFQYIVNFPFSLGQKNGGRTNFHQYQYGKIMGDELTDKQNAILFEPIKNSNSAIIKEMSSDNLKRNFERFSERLVIRNIMFINLKDEKTRFSELDNLIRDFLADNQFSTSVSKLRNHWLGEGLKNGSQKLSLSRTRFLFGILLMDDTFSSDQLLGKKIGRDKAHQLYDRFVSTVEEVSALEEFNRSLTADILTFFPNLDSIDDYFYSEDETIEFVREHTDKYVKYFSMNNLSEHERKSLTRFALARCLEQNDIINRLLSKGEIRSASN
jgi:hypothetical protein